MHLPRSHHTHFFSCALGSRLKELHWCSQPFVLKKISSPFAPCRHRHSLHQTQHTLHSTQHLLTSYADHMEAHPLHSGPFGSLAIRSPLTGYEPNPTLAVISAQDTPANATSRRQVSVPHKIQLRKSRRSPCSRVRWTIRALDDWLHRCSSRREKQVSFSLEFITLKEKTPRHTDRTEARGDLFQDTHASGNRAESAQVHRTAERSEVRGFKKNPKTRRSSRRATSSIDCKSRKWNLIREYFSKITGIKKIHRHNSKCFWRRRRRMQCKICTDNFVLKIRSCTSKVETMKLRDRNKP